MNDIEFQFSEPDHGWMEVSVKNSDKNVCLAISDAPCDSISKLAQVLLSLQSGSEQEEVEYSLEPEYALWKFVVENEQMTLSVYPDSGRSNPILFTGNKDKILKRLYKSLRDLESMSCWSKPDALETIWSWEFPSRELNEFKANDKNA